MKKIILLSTILLTLVSCGVKQHTTLAYNHVTGECRINNEIQYPRDVEIIDRVDDEFAIALYGKEISKVQPLTFGFKYYVQIEEGCAYFYSPFMSEYMQDNEWFVFDLTYSKVKF